MEVTRITRILPVRMVHRMFQNSSNSKKSAIQFAEAATTAGDSLDSTSFLAAGISADAGLAASWNYSLFDWATYEERALDIPSVFRFHLYNESICKDGLIET